jgi:hypothetical protein
VRAAGKALNKALCFEIEALCFEIALLKSRRLVAKIHPSNRKGEVQAATTNSECNRLWCGMWVFAFLRPRTGFSEGDR